MFDIQQNGVWNTDEPGRHSFDENLALGIAALIDCDRSKSCYDFGCGLGQYTQYLNDHGIATCGYDGNPKLNDYCKTCVVLDLSKEFNLNFASDWVVSLEVGEHIPVESEGTFISNVTRHSKSGLILSWAIPGTGGDGHVNPRFNDYIISKVAAYGFRHYPLASRMLRSMASLWWFKDTVMVFRKI